jgi:hypothetical protein
MFVTWSCGCIGMLVTVQGTTQAWCIHGCDDRGEGADDVLALWNRPHNLEKAWTELSEAEVAALHTNLSRQLQDGSRFRIIRDLLK